MTISIIVIIIMIKHSTKIADQDTIIAVLHMIFFNWPAVLLFLFFLEPLLNTHTPMYNAMQKSTILTVAKLIQPWAIVNKNKGEI